MLIVDEIASALNKRQKIFKVIPNGNDSIRVNFNITVSKGSITSLKEVFEDKDVRVMFLINQKKKGYIDVIDHLKKHIHTKNRSVVVQSKLKANSLFPTDTVLSEKATVYSSSLHLNKFTYDTDPVYWEENLGTLKEASRGIIISVFKDYKLSFDMGELLGKFHLEWDKQTLKYRLNSSVDLLAKASERYNKLFNSKNKDTI